MSSWTHNICFECWDRRFDRQPAFVEGIEKAEACCFCGKMNTDAIYVRGNPKELLCKGDHENSDWA